MYGKLILKSPRFVPFIDSLARFWPNQASLMVIEGGYLDLSVAELQAGNCEDKSSV